MSLEKYAQGNEKNSFCYWLEFKGILFGIGGGNASKFGIYRGKDGNYYSGSARNKVKLEGDELYNFYSSIRTNIIKALQYTENDEVEKISSLDIPLWNMVLLKILSLYNPHQFIRIGAPNALIKCAQDISLKNCELVSKNSIVINNLIHKKLKGHDFFKEWPEEKLSSFIWQEYGISDFDRNYYILGPKYGDDHNVDIFDKMIERSVVAVGFADHIDLTEYYSLPHLEIINYLENEGEEKKSQTALKHFLSLKPGDLIAIKSDGSSKGNKGYLKIVGYAEVIDKDGVVYEYDPDDLGHVVHVRYLTPKISNELEIGGYGSTIHKISNKDKIKQIFPSNFTKRTTIIQRDSNLSLNTILYGPPGTGKTYKLKNEYFAQFTDEHSTKTKEEFVFELVQNLSWWAVVSIIMLDLKKAKVQDIFDHPILKAKIHTTSNKHPKPAIWATLQSYTKTECPNVKYQRRIEPLYFWKDESSTWTIDEEIAKLETPDFYEILESYKSFVPQRQTEKRFVFTTFHQSFSYEDFIEGIKPHLTEEIEDTISQDVRYHIANGIFKEISQKAKKNPQKEYAIFIDEINRGNIANIFGELITLIEDDKRMGADNEIIATLPYSKEEFGVPKNLYIIGTMNTADRSVEALDTALRRRFSFVEMNPQPQLLSESDYKLDDLDLEKLLTTINSRIEKLLDKDYCIGHSYFMTIKDKNEPLEELRTIFSNKIIPLLQEYFYCDWGKILLVLGKGFITQKDNSISFLATDQYADFDEFESKPIYCFTPAESWSMDTFKGIYEPQE